MRAALLQAVRSRAGVALADTVLAAVVTVAAVAVHLDGSEAVPANHAPTPLSVVLTALTGALLVVRRRFPVPVLITTSGAVVALAVLDQSVGMSTIGPMIAFYTAVAHGLRRAALTVLAVVIALTALLRPVDLSTEGTLVSLAALAFAGSLANAAYERRERHETELRQATERVVVQERLRITRELHDVLGHALSVMVVQAEAAERLLLLDSEKAASAIHEVSATGRGSLAEMRRLLTIIRDGEEPSAAREPAPTLAELPALVEGVRAAGLEVSLAPLPESLSPGVELAAYRVVQEALTNSLRHSGASSASVCLRRQPGALEVEVLDNGRGASDLTFGTGLTGMRERVAVYGGTFSAGGRPGGGFAVRAEFLLSAAS